MKIEAFKYFCSKVSEKGESLGSSKEWRKRIGRFGIMRLLFLSMVAMFNQDRDKGSALAGIFNSFYALPLGPADADLINWTYSSSEHYDFDSAFEHGSLKVSPNLSDETKAIIDSSVKNIPSSLFDKNQVNLSMMSMNSASWKNAMEKAVKAGKKTEKMDYGEIEAEDIIMLLMSY